MKKVVSILITLAVVLSCISFSVIPFGASNKITDELQKQIIKTGDNNKPVQEQVEPGYYLYSKDTRGIMTPSNKFVRTDDTDHEEYVLRNCKLYASEKFLNMYTADGLKATSVYPKYNPYILYGYIKADGLYDIYFRPNRDGDDYTDNFGWVYKTMRVEYKGSEDVYKHYLYQDRFNAYIRERYVVDGDYEYDNYDEVYYHKDKNGETDWVLIQAEIPIFEPTIGNWFVSNRVVASFGGYCPFYGMMGIYDVKKDQFLDVIYIDTSQYDDFEEIYDKVGYGQLMGDLDLDNEISVMDVTILQRCHAEIIPFPQSDEIKISYGWGPSYIEPYSGKRIRYCSDFDRNGTRDIIDATCIQRYLAGLPYPVEPPYPY